MFKRTNDNSLIYALREIRRPSVLWLSVILSVLATILLIVAVVFFIKDTPWFQKNIQDIFSISSDETDLPESISVNKEGKITIELVYSPIISLENASAGRIVATILKENEPVKNVDVEYTIQSHPFKLDIKLSDVKTTDKNGQIFLDLVPEDIVKAGLLTVEVKVQSTTKVVSIEYKEMEDNDIITDRLSLDRDEDGLPDITESLFGTDHLEEDSDGDGVGDGEEVYIYKTNPIVSNLITLSSAIQFFDLNSKPIGELQAASSVFIVSEAEGDKSLILMEAQVSHRSVVPMSDENQVTLDGYWIELTHKVIVDSQLNNPITNSPLLSITGNALPVLLLDSPDDLYDQVRFFGFIESVSVVDAEQ